jgi:DNA-binding MarR family transcriptional regulator
MTPDRGAVTDDEPDVSAAELTERVMRVAHLIRRTSMASLAPHNLTPAQSRALRTITKADAPIRMGELASTLGVVPRSATGLVDALQEAGLVERGADPDNRRSVLVTLTEAGRRMQRAMADARAAAGDGIFGRLTSEERRTLADLLGRVGAAGATAQE